MKSNGFQNIKKGWNHRKQSLSQKPLRSRDLRLRALNLHFPSKKNVSSNISRTLGTEITFAYKLLEYTISYVLLELLQYIMLIIDPLSCGFAKIYYYNFFIKVNNSSRESMGNPKNSQSQVLKKRYQLFLEQFPG